MKSLVVVDFSNFVHTCWWPAVSAQEAQNKHIAGCQACQGAAYGLEGYKYCPDLPEKYDARKVLLTNLAGKMRTIERAMEEAEIRNPEYLFVEDRDSKRKYEIYPLYKANRERGADPVTGDPPFDPRPLAKEWCRQSGYTQFCHSPDNEADDAIASIMAMTPHTPEFAVVIVSSDKDLWQLMNPPYVWIYQITKDKFVTPEDVLKKFGVSRPEYIPLHKTLWGDSGDNVPNIVPRMQKALIPIIERSNGTLADFLELCLADLNHKRAWELLNDAMASNALYRNWNLVNLDKNCPLVWEIYPS